MTNYERLQCMIAKAQHNADYYARNNDKDLADFWNNCVTGLKRRLDSLTISQASVRVK